MERRKFTREFKVEAVELIHERGVTVAQAARDLGLHGTVLRRWVQESAAEPAPPEIVARVGEPMPPTELLHRHPRIRLPQEPDNLCL